MVLIVIPDARFAIISRNVMIQNFYVSDVANILAGNAKQILIYRETVRSTIPLFAPNQVYWNL